MLSLKILRSWGDKVNGRVLKPSCKEGNLSLKCLREVDTVALDEDKIC